MIAVKKSADIDIRVAMLEDFLQGYKLYEIAELRGVSRKSVTPKLNEIVEILLRTFRKWKEGEDPPSVSDIVLNRDAWVEYIRLYRLRLANFRLKGY